MMQPMILDDARCVAEWWFSRCVPPTHSMLRIASLRPPAASFVADLCWGSEDKRMLRACARRRGICGSGGRVCFLQVVFLSVAGHIESGIRKRTSTTWFIDTCTLSKANLVLTNTEADIQSHSILQKVCSYRQDSTLHSWLLQCVVFPCWTFKLLSHCFPQKRLAHSFYSPSFLDDKSGQDDRLQGRLRVLGLCFVWSGGLLDSGWSVCQGMLPGIYGIFWDVRGLCDSARFSQMRRMAGKERSWLRPPRAPMFVEWQGKYSHGSGHRTVHIRDMVSIRVGVGL